MTELPVDKNCVDSESEISGVPKSPPYLFRQRRKLTEKGLSGIPGAHFRSESADSEMETCTASDDEGANPRSSGSRKDVPFQENLDFRYREDKNGASLAQGEPSIPRQVSRQSEIHLGLQTSDPMDEFRRELRDMVLMTQDALTAMSDRLTSLEQKTSSSQMPKSVTREIADQAASSGHPSVRPPQQSGMKVALHPPKFDGQGDWTAFKIQFENCADLAGWDKPMRARMLGQCMEKTSRRFYTNLSESERMSYDELLVILSRRFGDAPAEIYRSQLNARSRKSGESIQDLRDDLWRLVCKAYPGMSYDAKESLTLQSLLNMVDVNTRLHLASKGVISLQEAVHAIENYEAIMGADKKGKKQNKGANFEVLATAVDDGATSKDKGNKSKSQKGNGKKPSDLSFSQRLSKLEEAIKKISDSNSRDGSAGPSKPKNFQGKDSVSFRSKSQDGGKSKTDDGTRSCFRCGDPGHFIRDCPVPENGAGAGNGSELDRT